jgi:hypothetical protein
MQGLASISVTMPFAWSSGPKRLPATCRSPDLVVRFHFAERGGAGRRCVQRGGTRMSESAEERLAGRRRLIKFTGASLLLTVSPLSQAAANRNPGVLAVRIWPAADYTRVAIEHGAPLKYTHFMVKEPGASGRRPRRHRVQQCPREPGQQGRCPTIPTSSCCAPGVTSRASFAW